MNSDISTKVIKDKFKSTLCDLMDNLSIVCVRLDKYEKPEGMKSYDKIAIAKIAISTSDVDNLLKHYDNIFSKYKEHIKNKDIMFFKQVQLYPGISQETISFIFRMFEKDYGLRENEKLLIWKYIDKLMYYISKLRCDKND